MSKRGDTIQSIGNSVRAIHELDRGVLPIILARSLSNAAAPFVGIVLSAYALDRMAERAPLAQALPIVLALVAAFLALNVAASVLHRMYTVRGNRVYLSFQYRTGDKTMEMDYPQAENPETARLRDRITQDQNWGSGIWSIMYGVEWLAQSAFTLLGAAVLFIMRFWGTPIFATWATPVYLFAVVAVTLALSAVGARLNAGIYKRLDNSSSKGRLFFHLLFDRGITYRQGKEVRVYGIDRLLERRLDRDMSDKGALDMLAVGHISGVANAVGGTLEALVQGGAFLFVALLASGGALSIGSVFLFAGVLQQFSNAIVSTSLGYSELAVAAHRMDSNFEYFRLPTIMHAGTLPVEKRTDDRYEISVNDVSFKYPGSDAYALRHVSLRLHIGERLAVVGRNGSGKTTLIKLLCRLYDPTEGNITLNGIDIRKYDQDEYRRIFSVVFQDFSLPSLPLGVDVACEMDVDRDRAERALRLAGFGDRLDALPQGLDTPLYKDFAEDGIELSGGEAQKVALARALYKAAPFVILDEPTAALDPIAEFDVYNRFNDIVGGRTAVFISHRLSSCRFCHDIAVFDAGRLVQRGGHDALLREGGRYRELWEAQAQYYA